MRRELRSILNFILLDGSCLALSLSFVFSKSFDLTFIDNNCYGIVLGVIIALIIGVNSVILLSLTLSTSEVCGVRRFDLYRYFVNFSLSINVSISIAVSVALICFYSLNLKLQFIVLSLIILLYYTIFIIIEMPKIVMNENTILRLILRRIKTNYIDGNNLNELESNVIGYFLAERYSVPELIARLRTNNNVLVQYFINQCLIIFQREAESHELEE